MHIFPPAWPPPRPPCSSRSAPLPPSQIRSPDSPPATCPAPRPPPAPRLPPVPPVVQTHCSPPSTLSSQPSTNSLVFSSSFPLLPKGTAKNTPRHVSRKDSPSSSRSTRPFPHKDRPSCPIPSKNIPYSRAF